VASKDGEKGPESAEGKDAEEVSEKVPESISGEGGTPWGSSGEHSEAPGPHGTGEVYPRGDRPEEDDSHEDDPKKDG
jgi:hypothetical protein